MITDIPNCSLFAGDNVEVMRREIQDASVQLTVTSPPYDNLRTYKGFSWDFEVVARELYRVTKPGGVVVWVVADATVNGSETGTSFRQALYFKECGFNLHDTMIWEKDGIKFPDANRYQQCYEFMFVLSKGKPLFNPIQDHKNVSFGRLVHGTDRNADGTTRPMSGVGKQIKEYGTRWNVWRLKPERGPIRKEHPAVFPEALAQDHILSWSNPGDTVLDPFSGSGTTGKAALLNSRSFIGIDISPAYVDLAAGRIRKALNLAALASNSQDIPA